MIMMDSSKYSTESSEGQIPHTDGTVVFAQQPAQMDCALPVRNISPVDCDGSGTVESRDNNFTTDEPKQPSRAKTTAILNGLRPLRAYGLIRPLREYREYMLFIFP